VTHEDAVLAVLGKERPTGWCRGIIPRTRRSPRAARTPPTGCPDPPAGLRRSRATMNPIAASATPRQRTGRGTLIGHSLGSLE